MDGEGVKKQGEPTKERERQADSMYKVCTFTGALKLL